MELFSLETWELIVPAFHLAGAFTSVRAIMDVRTSQGAIAWAVALNTFPYLAVPAYWVFGRKKFHGYISRRREELIKTSPAAKKLSESLIAQRMIAEEGEVHSQLIEGLSKLPFTSHNDAELLVDGDAVFQSIFAGIDAAKFYILVEFYILRDDIVGRELQKRLIAKAKAGVKVSVLFDEVGSKKLSKEYQAELRAAGVSIHPFNTRQGKSNRWQLNFRNHRKIVVVDGDLAWIGGLNVGDEYLGHGIKLKPWRDTHVKLMGPVVIAAQLAFYEDWHWATHQFLELDWDPDKAPSGANRSIACVASGPADPMETCTLFFLQAIQMADTRLWIASPYFVPDEQFISSLQLASLRGVDVRILIPHTPDGPLVQLSAWSYVADLERAGVKVYHHRAGFMHQKVVLVDDDYATIGTANFDNRSFRLNFEITVAFADEEFVGQVKRMLEADFENSRVITAKELDDRGFVFRLCMRLARLMAPVQ